MGCSRGLELCVAASAIFTTSSRSLLHGTLSRDVLLTTSSRKKAPHAHHSRDSIFHSFWITTQLYHRGTKTAAEDI